MTALGRAAGVFIVGFLLAVACSFALAPFLGQNFFPPVANTQIKLHVRAPTGTRIEETARICDGVEAAIRQIIPPRRSARSSTTSACRSAASIPTYNNSGTVGPADADILITLKPEYEGEADALRQEDARDAAEVASRARLSRSCPPTSSRRSSISACPRRSTCRSSAPISTPTASTPTSCCKRIARVPGVADARIQQASNNPTLNVDVDRDARGASRPDRRRRRQEPSGERCPAASRSRRHSGSTRRTASPIRSSRRRRNIGSIRSRRWRTFPPRKADASQILGGLATIKRGVSPAVVSHYAVQPVIDIFATNNERDLGAVSADIQQILDETAQGRAARLERRLRGQTATMTSAYQQLFVGIALGDRADLPADRRQLPVLARSVRHRQRVADRARRASSGCCSSRTRRCRFRR